MKWLVDRVSENMTLDRDMVNLVLRHAWSEVRHKISTASARNIFVRYIGTFRVKGVMRILDEHIRKKINLARWKVKNRDILKTKGPEETKEEIYRFLQYRRFYKRKFAQQKKNKHDYFSAIRDRGAEQSSI